MFVLGSASVSNLYTFLYDQTQAINANDQQIFFVFENGRGDLQSQIKMFKQQSFNFISDGISYTSSINTVFIIITGVILTLLILVVIYFMIFFFSFKYKVLGYFAELEKESIHISELCATEF